MDQRAVRKENNDIGSQVVTKPFPRQKSDRSASRPTDPNSDFAFATCTPPTQRPCSLGRSTRSSRAKGCGTPSGVWLALLCTKTYSIDPLHTLPRFEMGDCLHAPPNHLWLVCLAATLACPLWVICAPAAFLLNENVMKCLRFPMQLKTQA